MLVLVTTISVPDFMLVSKSAQFTRNFKLCHRTDQSSMPSTDVIQLTLTLKMTTAQVVEMSVTVNNNRVLFKTTFTWTIILNLLMK